MDIWVLTQSLACHRKPRTPGKVTLEGIILRDQHLLNRDEVFALSRFWRSRQEPIPPAHLQLRVEDFDEDYFESDGCYFVSERFRQVMALDASTARYFDVDASWSAPLPRSKNYQIMAPLVEDDVLNWKLSVEFFTPPIIDSPARNLHLRSDAVPKDELFSDKNLDGALLCTDALAQRVLEAGCTGMRFYDLKYHFRLQQPFRTLLGVEESLGWDEVNDVEITKPFHPSDD